MCLTVVVKRSLVIDTPLLKTIVQYGLNGQRAVKFCWVVYGYTLALSVKHRLPRLLLPASFLALLHGIIVATVRISTGTPPSEPVLHMLMVQRDLFLCHMRGARDRQYHTTTKAICFTTAQLKDNTRIGVKCFSVGRSIVLVGCWQMAIDE
jgi:hypothetical protein